MFRRDKLVLACGVFTGLQLLFFVRSRMNVNVPVLSHRYSQSILAPGTIHVHVPQRPNLTDASVQPPPNSTDLGSVQIPLDTSESTLCTQFYCHRCKTNTTSDCLELMLNRTVFVNAMSSNHYDESYNMIASIQKIMPGRKIVVYDLGLNVTQVEDLRKMCDVELRPFQFNNYPAHVSASALSNFAWKPLTIKEVSLEYEIVVWMDTSIRFKTSLKEHIFPYLLKANLTYVGLPLKIKVSIENFTHDSMIAYLNLTREELAGLQIQAGFGVYWITEPLRMILDAWVDCALHESCIAPKGATRSKCTGGMVVPSAASDTHHCQRHRFDQSAFDLILYKHYSIDSYSYRGLYRIMTPLAWRTCLVERAQGNLFYKIRYCVP